MDNVVLCPIILRMLGRDADSYCSALSHLLGNQTLINQLRPSRPMVLTGPSFPPQSSSRAKANAPQD